MKKSGSQGTKSPSQLIDARIKELGDWRGKMLGRLRTLVKEADPEDSRSRRRDPEQVHSPKLILGKQTFSAD